VNEKKIKQGQKKREEEKQRNGKEKEKEKERYNKLERMQDKHKNGIKMRMH
jgi:hypothetical protein